MTCDTSKVKIQRHTANGNLIKRKPLNDSDDDLWAPPLHLNTYEI